MSRTVFALERIVEPDGFRRWKIMAIDSVPADISTEHAVELLGSCRRLTDRHDFDFRELWFGDEVLL